jgi:hypothetical protein
VEIVFARGNNVTFLGYRATMRQERLPLYRKMMLLYDRDGLIRYPYEVTDVVYFTTTDYGK